MEGLGGEESKTPRGPKAPCEFQSREARYEIHDCLLRKQDRLMPIEDWLSLSRWLRQLLSKLWTLIEAKKLDYN